MRKFLLLAAVMLLASAPAMAEMGGGCYSAKEFEAEQGLRIHSELMVIGLTCIKAPGGQRLYADYQTFTKKNSALIRGYENDIIAFYRAQGDREAEKKLHTLRTSLANKISEHAIKMSTGSFCKHFSPRIGAALTMSKQKLREWARHVWADSPTTQPVCVKAEW